MRHAGSGRRPPQLLDRAVELRRLDAVMAAACTGAGAPIVIRGPAGIGKSALLAAGAQRAQRAGMRTLCAAGHELERGFAFGVARQLFEPVLGAAAPRERRRLLSGAAGLARPLLEPDGGDLADPTADAGFAIQHGLYWLTAGVAERQPLALLVDDAHWADGASLRFLLYLARRLDGLACTVVVTVRPEEQERLGELVAPASTVDPRPLGRAAVARLARAALGDSGGAAFAEACRTATGGNPLLLRTLLDELAAAGSRGTDDEAAGVDGRGYGSIGRAAQARVGALGGAAAALASAVAVLGDGCEPHLARALAGLGEAAAADAADRLAAAQILEAGSPLRFVHPVVRASLAEAMPQARRSLAHARAAVLLMRAGADPEAVAAHLHRCPPAANPERVGPLRNAAAAAAARGDRDGAIEHLERALAEPPADTALCDVLLALGRLEVEAGARAKAREHLREALAFAADGDRRAEILLDLGDCAEGPPDEALVDLLVEARESARDPGVQERAERQVLMMARFVDSRRHLVDGTLETALAQAGEAHNGFDPDLLAFLAQETVFRHQRVERTIALAERALDPGGRLARQGLHAIGFTFAVDALTFAGAADRAHAALDAAFSDGGTRAPARWLLSGLLSRLLVFAHTGAVLDLEAHADDAIRVAGELGEPEAGLLFAPLLALAQLECGRAGAAERTLADHGLDGDPPGHPFIAAQALAVRARVKIERYRAAEAVDDLLAAGQLLGMLRLDAPGLLPWRSAAAECLLSIGRRPDARSLIADELRLAEASGAPAQLGQALRVYALARDAREVVPALERAAETLARSQARLGHARALVDLGAALRRSARRGEAREVLRDAGRRAQRLGAQALAQRAHRELEVAGGRPRTARLVGFEALTPAERRVAGLAASGLTNRQIAETLFLSRKTIETHLRAIYRKLGVSSREQVAALLLSER